MTNLSSFDICKVFDEDIRRSENHNSCHKILTGVQGSDYESRINFFNTIRILKKNLLAVHGTGFFPFRPQNLPKTQSARAMTMTVNDDNHISVI